MRCWESKREVKSQNGFHLHLNLPKLNCCDAVTHFMSGFGLLNTNLNSLNHGQQNLAERMDTFGFTAAKLTLYLRMPKTYFFALVASSLKYSCHTWIFNDWIWSENPILNTHDAHKRYRQCAWNHNWKFTQNFGHKNNMAANLAAVLVDDIYTACLLQEVSRQCFLILRWAMCRRMYIWRIQLPPHGSIGKLMLTFLQRLYRKHSKRNKCKKDWVTCCARNEARHSQATPSLQSTTQRQERSAYSVELRPNIEVSIRLQIVPHQLCKKPWTPCR